MSARASILLATAAVFVSLPLAAQTGAVEIGFDLGGDILWVRGDATGTIGIPVQSVRVGAFLGDQVSLEFDVGAEIVNIGEDADTFGRGAMAILFHADPDPSDPRAFIGAGVGLRFADVGGFSGTQFGVGGGVGYEWPFNSAAGARLAVRYIYSFETDSFLASHELAATLGFSLFLGRERSGRRS